eukprot:1743623-Rhodomonas_salina.1
MVLPAGMPDVAIQNLEVPPYGKATQCPVLQYMSSTAALILRKSPVLRYKLGAMSGAAVRSWRAFRYCGTELAGTVLPESDRAAWQ